MENTSRGARPEAGTWTRKQPLGGRKDGVGDLGPETIGRRRKVYRRIRH